MSAREANGLICCITCVAIATREAIANGLLMNAEQKDAYIAQEIWNKSWNISLPDEELEAFDHAKANPTHVLIQTIDYGFKVSGV